MSPMPRVTAHAALSPSSAERWLRCTASVEATAGITDTGSVYAAEGTLAHAMAEVEARRALGLSPAASPRIRQSPDEEAAGLLAQARRSGWDTDQMVRAAVGWADLLTEVTGAQGSMTWLERHVSPGVPGVWGTADATILTADGTLHVLDLKYGQGVPVEAVHNAQLMLYGLGGYELVRDCEMTPRTVHLAIYQPRAGGLREWTLPLAELLEWRESVRATVADIEAGRTEFRPGEAACRWCPIKATCRARIEWSTAQDFADGPLPATYAPEELPALIERAQEAQRWAAELLRHAFSLAEAGTEVPGYKLVHGRASRKIVDPARAVALLREVGRPELVRETPETITALERALGRPGLDALLGEVIEKTPGPLRLAPVDDAREAVAAADFERLAE